ncbi:M15 family metallopeptidase [Nitratifractor sp.]
MKKVKWMMWVLIFSMLGTAAYGKCDANAQRLVRAYPDHLKECRDNRIVWRDGTKMLYDDGKKKSFESLLNQADIEDMFRFRYPKGASGYSRSRGPSKNYDPGRIRNEKFFRKMYGNSAAEVRSHLIRIPWLPRSSGGRYRITVTRINGVDRALAAVSRDLDRLVARNPSLKKYLAPPGGGFYWRTIAGTHRLSVHSFGAAIDINVKHSAYWRWGGKHYRYRNEIPLSIVEIFERHGFIWGGKWYHYDTMHFEYRPELLGGERSTPPTGKSDAEAQRQKVHHSSPGLMEKIEELNDGRSL